MYLYIPANVPVRLYSCTFASPLVYLYIQMYRYLASSQANVFDVGGVVEGEFESGRGTAVGHQWAPGDAV